MNRLLSGLRLLAVTILILSLINMAGIAHGQDSVSNSLKGSVDDESRTWIVQNDGRHSSAIFTSPSPGVEHVVINAYDDERYARKESLSVELVINAGAIQSTSINYFPFSQSHPRFTLNENFGSGELTLDRIETGPLAATISGNFAGTLFYHQSPRTEPIPHRTRDLEFEFDLELQRE